MANGNEDIPPGEAEAAGGITKEEENLLQALHLLGIKPSLQNPEDVVRLLKVFRKIKDEPEAPPARTSHPVPEKTAASYHFAKLSTFFGEEGKGDVSWATYKYEVEALVSDGVYSKEQILQGIRRSLKGKASDKLRIMGQGVRIQDIMAKFETDYGTIESRECVMRKFYSCTQSQTETVDAYASRLEDLFDKAVRRDAVERHDTDMLKEVLHEGLRKELKLMTMFQKENSATYDEFKRELRKIEVDMTKEDNTETKKTCNAAVPSEKSELGEVKQLLKQLNDRIDSLEEQKVQQNYYNYSSRGQGFNGVPFRGRGYDGGTVRGRGFNEGAFRGRGQGFTAPPARGRGEYTPSRPVGRRVFEPTCYLCHQKGHLQRNCPTVSHVICYKCQEPGHISRNCPN